MGFLGLKSRQVPRTPRQLPTGSLSMDSTGHMLTCTLPQTFPQSQAIDIGRLVLAVFREAREAQLPLAELVFHYAALKITAREMRGGAMIFFAAKV